MSGGTTEIHKDTEPLITGTHDGATGTTILRDMDADFRSFGARVGLAIENETKGYIGVIETVTDTEITVSWAMGGAGEPLQFTDEDIDFTGDELSFGAYADWDKGDTYNIYKTAVKGSVISTNWVDLSSGFKTRPENLEDGLMPKDIDLDRDGQRVFGPNQPILG